MKNKYINPMMNIHEIAPMSLMAGSVTALGDIDTSEPVGGDAGDAAARELLEDDSIDLSKWIWTILFLLLSITVGAQTYTEVEPAAGLLMARRMA